MVNTIYLFSFVETPRKFVIAELSIRKLGSSSGIISTDENSSLRIESSAIINLRGVSTKLNKYNFIILSDDGFEIEPKYYSFNRFCFLNSSIEFTRCISSECFILYF